MTFESFPNTPHNTRAVTLGEHEQLMDPLGLSGLVNYGTGVTPVYGDSTGLHVKLRNGVSALIRGTRFNATSETVLTIGANSSGNPRVDLVVLRLNRSDYQITPTVIAGTAATSPVAPQPVRNEPGGSPNYFDVPLAEVTVINAAATITATQVVNRAWWITGSGYVGNSTARPPVTGGVLWRENDTGISYIGSNGGTWQRIYHYTGYVDGPQGGSWNFPMFSVARDGNLCVASFVAIRITSAWPASQPMNFGPIPAQFRPDRTVYAPYYVSGRSGRMAVLPDGTLRFLPDNIHPVAVGEIISANPTWVTPA